MVALPTFGTSVLRVEFAGRDVSGAGSCANGGGIGNRYSYSSSPSQYISGTGTASQYYGGVSPGHL